MVEEFEQLQPVLLLPFDRFIIQVEVPLAQKQVMKIALKSLVRRRYISASVLENLSEVILQPMPQWFPQAEECRQDHIIAYDALLTGGVR